MRTLGMKIAALTAVLAMATCADASVVSSIPGGTLVPTPAVQYFGTGPQTVAPGITWSSTNGDTFGGSVFGVTGPYGFGGNGFWDGLVMAGLNTTSQANHRLDTMTFAFDTPVAAVGGFLNWSPLGRPAFISAWDSNHNLIETADLDFVLSPDSVNDGRFLGFAESAPVISYFTLTDAFIGITGLTIAAEPVRTPEPLSLAMFAAGLLALRRRKPS